MDEQELMQGVAIIGMAGRFPGAADLDAFWRNLVEGKDTITRFSADQLEARNEAALGAAGAGAGAGGADYVCARGVLEDVGMFDAEYFGVSPKEAERMDPQHRIFLEACSNALEDGGYGGEYAGEIGLFAGCSLNTYLLANLMGDRAALEELTGNYQVGEFGVALGNDKDFLTTRAAYKLNLRGPVMSVQSACATSLVAICQASQALLNYACDMALAGGVSATFPQMRGHVFQEGGIVSEDGHCRPFDAAATGTVFGHGVGVVLLKRVEDAVRDGDTIAAVIRGFAVNNDGSAKAGYMAPGVDGQARVIAAAQAMAGVAAETITYVEAHGTGTPLGDPIEFAALTQAFRMGTEAEGFCTIGAAKGNVGHLDSAAGVTGVMKTALQMRHRMVPGLMHFAKANAEVEVAGSPFKFSGENAAWESAGPLRAGVSAFGVGGVNAHVVMEEAPAVAASAGDAGRQVICVSGRTEAAARKAAENLAAWFEARPEASVADAAWTLAVGRKRHGFRVGVGAATAEEAAKALRGASVRSAAGTRKVAWMFSGQGTQFVGMGRELYEGEAVYRAVVDECAEAMRAVLGQDLREVMYGGESAEELLAQTRYAQPALFATELALATLWEGWGVPCEAMVGHSLGEYVAATLAGGFTRGDAARLVCVRGAMMQGMAAGAMVSVALGEAELRKYVGGEVSLAALNSPRASVLAGPLDAMDALEARLAADGVGTRRLKTSHAFHSAMMEPMLAGFAEEVGKVWRSAPTRRFVSSVTGAWITAEQATSAEYWVRQCREAVRFGDAVATLVADGCDVLLEVGPGETLCALAKQGAREVKAVGSFSRAGRTVQDAVGELWALGVGVDLERVMEGVGRRRIALPTYPFERKLHWVEPPARAGRTMDDKEDTTMATMMMEDGVGDAASEPRAMRLRVEVAKVFTELSGIETTPEEAEHQFLELGFDSLFLTQATQTMSRKFGVKLTFRQMMEQFSTIASLAEHLDEVLPVEAFAVEVARPSVAAAAPQGAGGIERLLADQLAAMSEMFAAQVGALRAAATGVGGRDLEHPTLYGETGKDGAPKTVAGSQKAITSAAVEAPAEVRMVRAQTGKAQGETTAGQQAYIDALVTRYAAKTPGSKRMTAAGRGQLADPRAVAGFRPQWKEMVYPLITERAKGARIWDVDGNEYIDIVNGYGCIMFGHSPEFVVRAAREQLELGVAIGPQTALAAEVAGQICEMTGNERVTFCNTGSEAVMAAIRVARTVTGRDKIIYFAGDYHGTFDEVLIRTTPRGSAPVAPGIPLSNTGNVVVLEYGAASSLEYIRAHGADIAAVLVEPVQTRNPGLQPVEFMREVRAITERAGAAMILDEVVTGFRLAPGGAQAHFGIRADMCTYGKVIGGGHPIGVLSGKREYLDALDGGAWEYGDDSGPEVGVTFFAGTFVRHPLALAAARSVLRHLKEAGPGLQAELNAKTARLAEALDRFFVERGVPSRVNYFCSWLYFTFAHDAKFGSLFYYVMRAKGIHIQEGYPVFLTTAHTDADIAAVETAFRETIVEMQEAGVLPAAIAPVRAVEMHPQALAEAPREVPLTEPQREVFLAAALNDEANCAFNESLTLELRGAVREGDLREALRLALARHDALRSTVSEDGERLVIGGEAPVCGFVDLRGDAGAEEALRAAILAEGRTAFDLVRGPLVRATCYRMSEDRAVLVMTGHHMVLDGWSANQVLEDAGKFYSKGAAGAELEPLLPFSSYAVIEKQRGDAGEFAANEAYWVEKFAGRSPRLELPTDRPRGMEKSYRGATFEGRVGGELYQELKKASAKAGCTLYVTLLSAFEGLMHRLCGQDEVVVGISTAGQALYEGASLVGHAVHFLPMLSEVREGMTAAEHLKQTKAALLDAYDHQEFTYGSMLRMLKLEREPGRLPLIEVQFNLERVGANVRFDGLDVRMKGNAKQFVNTDLFLNVMETATELEFACDFNTDLFDEATLARWMGEWEELLRSIARGPGTLVDELAIMPAAEREEVLRRWNATAVDFGKFESVHGAFLRRAAAEPGRVALECGGVAWSYEELAAYSRRLAGRLVAEGLRAGELVGICVERSAEMVGAVLAVMMAGGAYVPLDPRHPKERLEMVLEDAGANLLLVSGELGLTTAAKTLDVRGLAGVELEAMTLAEDSLAYVIYTSGSTGKPKGVAVEHGALVNLLRSMEREPGMRADDVMVAITTLAFDIAGLELLLPLVTGAKLVVATDSEVQDGAMLLKLMQRSGATVLQGTPGAWRILMDAGWTGACEAGTLPVKALCGGEALPRALADKILDRTPELWNVYGPTETTIWSAAGRVEAGTGPVRIGAPIANTTMYVLDARRQIVPIGVTGELYIGGAGLARGYWNRPELTAEKFIPNPFGMGRIYATGDVARRLVDGSLELLGRTDFQVKVRGYRIELAEIEGAMMRLPGVREAVVMQDKSGPGGASRLVGYVAAGFGGEDARAGAMIAELPVTLLKTLPDYMVPAVFVVLAQLPRTANGKIDRKALPAADAVAAGAERSFTAAKTAEEKLLAEIWAEVLELKAVSTTDSVFELGADSLLIFRMAARAQREGLPVNATLIFQKRTIVGICEALTTADEGKKPSMKVTTRITAAARDHYRLPKTRVDATIH